MIKVENTHLEALDVYDKLEAVKLANRFLMDSIELILYHYEKSGDCPTQPEPRGAGMVYLFIEDKLSEVMEMFNEYEK